MPHAMTHARRFARPSRLAVLAVIVYAAAACDGEIATAPGVPSTPPYMSGRITSIVQSSTTAGTVRIEANPTSPNVGLKAVAQVDAITVVLLPDRTRSVFRTLAPGQWVRVWFDGAIAESYPVQGTAGTIVIDSLAVTPSGG